jgi:hypothetical protein
VAFLLTTNALAAEQVAWNDTAQLGAELPSSWFPEIVADQTGTVWAVWETTYEANETSITDANGGAIMLARLDEDGWSEPANIHVKDIYNAGRPILFSDGMYMHLLVRTVPPGEPILELARIFHLRAPLSANLLDARAWSQPQPLSDAAAYWGQITATPDGTLVATYNQIIEAFIDGAPEGRTALFSRRSTDHGTTWEPPVRVSHGEQRAVRNSLLAFADGTLVVAWDEGYDNLTGLGTPVGGATAVSTDGGLTWEGHTTFRRHTEQSTLATDGERVLLLYRSTVDNGLYYRESLDQGHTWSDELVVPDAALEPYSGPHNFHRLGVATDSAGAITVAYIGAWTAAETGIAVLTVTFADGEWSAPVLAARASGYPEYPRVAVALGNQLRLVYFVRQERFADSEPYTIWAVSGSTAAPALTPQPLLDAPAPAPVVVEPAVEPIQLEAFPTTPPAPEPFPASAHGALSPQATLDQPIIWVIAATIGALLTILAMHVAWRTLQDTRF